MKKRVETSSKGLRVSASELAQMGVCERLVVFEKCYGKRRSRMQRQAMHRGVHAHQRFYRAGKLDAFTTGRSVFASRTLATLLGWLMKAARVAAWPLRWCIALWAKAVERSDGA